MFSKLETFFHSSRVFSSLVAFRWAALIPALLLLLQQGKTEAFPFLPPLWVFLIVLLANVVISLFNRILNRLVVERPFFMGIDLLFCAFILTVSGGSRSPYYLYALSPLLAGAFFFQMRGALGTAASFTFLYLGANFITSRFNGFQPVESVTLITQLAGIWLIPILFAYPSILLKEINRARDELAAARDELAEKHENLAGAHRQLRVIHDLTVLLQAAPDLISVQQRVLGAVTTGLGFRRAIVGVVDPARDEMGGWMLYPVNSSFPSIEPLPLKAENGEVFKALIERKPYTSGADGEVLVKHSAFNSWLKTCRWYVYPLSLREHAVGVLLVELERDKELSRQRQDAVTMVANQAALALGTTILCIDRARRLAVETERNRIARDIHDTVAQSLFGIVYSLDACITMLPAQADEVKRELMDLRALAGNAHDEVRRSIFDLWPSTLTMELFQSDLQNYVAGCCRPRPFEIVFDHNGDFDHLPSGLRRTLYRMAQEALANSARHSGAASAKVCLTVADGEVYLVITDEGRGFDPETALARSVNREHFGLRGIQERARALGGDCEIHSRPGAGARIMINLPINGYSHV
ncbi:MAG: GAF domain-containing sensor histidine kinase [Chloroflexota bacterium]|nr:GAF domain-containing sensor histidine kinase [Chloroflexota bacterium]MBI5702670.1 GAF domain-containing sensor histidine kinase [Chloroflexota bacterium]